MDTGTDSDDFVRVHALVRCFVDKGMSDFDDAWHAGHAPDEYEFVNLVRTYTRVFETGFDRADGALKQVVAKLLHLSASQLGADVLRPAGVGSDEGKVDVVLLRAGDGDLSLFRFLFDALEGVGLLAQVHAVLTLKLV